MRGTDVFHEYKGTRLTAKLIFTKARVALEEHRQEKTLSMNGKGEAFAPENMM